jgi:hypothetical protein
VGSVEPLRKLHARWSPFAEFVSVIVRQGHPGPNVPGYHSFARKLRDARLHRREDGVTWTVLVDDVAGTVHRAYGMLADPTFLIDAGGRIAFYNAMTHAPTLHRALITLAAQDGRGVVRAGFDRRPHFLHVIVGGWPALRRGLPHPDSSSVPLPGSRVGRGPTLCLDFVSILSR